MFKRPYPDDRELEQLLSEGHLRTAPPMRDYVDSLSDRIDHLTEMVENLELSYLRVQSSIDKLSSPARILGQESSLEIMKEQSREKARQWREALSLGDDTTRVNGFQQMAGALKKYKKADDDAVELLRRYRSE